MRYFLLLIISVLLVSCGTTSNQDLASSEPYTPTYPKNYEASIKQYLKFALKDYDSMKGFEITKKPSIGTLNYGAFKRGPEGKNFENKVFYVCAMYNAKNSMGGYVGYKPYAFFFEGEEMVNSILVQEYSGTLGNWSCR